MIKFDSSQKIGDIVVAFPKAADILKEYKIDFCCGGNRPLAEAIKEQGLDEKEVLGKINDLYEKYHEEQRDKNWGEASITELVDQIVNKHHAYLWSELPKISELTTLILRVHGPSHPELAKVHKLFHILKMDLESHLTKEEAVQYPAINDYAKSNLESDLNIALGVIEELEQEHDAAGDILKEMREVTGDYKIPSDVCDTFISTYNKLQELENDMFQHIHLENNILFPKLRSMRNA
ncbi:MAG: iron-sulfur cluster repair di-iron protein [Anaerovoracaceae bacterium]|jgi:regulator of cell morphogenesis and NO signaling|nr:iron-sulfur cluster repair di-iron protein [Clostridiales bacterium UBA9856]HOA42476.1 iron-sulfur cluster repair di-iron protein [Bacillota bacterium]HPZ60152.1 iron-sulfur cluster repair di-iron protein [Bacillota bacterium]HQC82803.1 iron-sulfur cluster repair di-iron protein [Bacillota bacterium]